MSAARGEHDVGFDAVLRGTAEAHRRLLRTVDDCSPEDVSRPSLLPGWTVGHVLSHVARNADSHTRMLEAAARGEHVEQYAGGHEQRSRDIEAGAARPGTEILDDVRRSTADLESAWAALAPDAWDGHGLSMGRPWPCRQIVFHRWREVELHHADLGLGYTPEDWPAAYVALELPIALAQLPERLDVPASRQLFAWLVGRAAQPADVSVAPWQTAGYGVGDPWARSSGV